MPGTDGDKEMRGHVLMLGGSREMPGAVILAATAALRAGAGKLTIATGASVAQLVALAMPEARVIGLTEARYRRLQPRCRGQPGPAGRSRQCRAGRSRHADEASTARLVHALMPRLVEANVGLVLDACAMDVLLHPPEHWPEGKPMRFDRPVIMTPHCGEMAHLTGIDKDCIVGLPDAPALRGGARLECRDCAQGCAHRDRCAGRHAVAARRRRQCRAGQSPARATCWPASSPAWPRAARPLTQAACWGVALHARAGDRLAQRLGPLGYLAREIAAEVPALLEQIGRQDLSVAGGGKPASGDVHLGT